MKSQRIIIGMGTGRCGTRSLAKLLSQQRGTRITHEERPLLPWRNARASVLVSRLERMQLTRSESILGDVASFYLPYAEHAIEFSPEVRMVCLKRPREEVVKSFCDWLDSVHPLPTNHWAIKPAAGWFHEPVYTRMFPQYDCENREEGIRRYWTEYYQRAELLTERFPQRVRVFDSQTCLNTEAGQRELLDFCGFERQSQVVVPEIHENKGDAAPRRRAAAYGSKDVNDPRRCVVLVPFYSHVDPPCDEALRELERRGYSVRRLGGFAAIDQGKTDEEISQLISAAFYAGKAVILGTRSDATLLESTHAYYVRLAPLNSAGIITKLFLYNPWGVVTGVVPPDMVDLTVNQFSANLSTLCVGDLP